MGFLLKNSNILVEVYSKNSNFFFLFFFFFARFYSVVEREVGKIFVHMPRKIKIQNSGEDNKAINSVK